MKRRKRLFSTVIVIVVGVDGWWLLVIGWREKCEMYLLFWITFCDLFRKHGNFVNNQLHFSRFTQSKEYGLGTLYFLQGRQDVSEADLKRFDFSKVGVNPFNFLFRINIVIHNPGVDCCSKLHLLVTHCFDIFVTIESCIKDSFSIISFYFVTKC